MKMSHIRSIQTILTKKSILFDIPLYGEILKDKIPIITVSDHSLKILFTDQCETCKEKQKQDHQIKDSEENEILKIE
jgi:hypothetical protein